MSRSDAFERVLFSLHDAALNDAMWPSASKLIDEACGLTGNELVVGQGLADDARVYFARFCYRGERRPDLEKMYYRFYYPVDERIPRARVLPDGQLVHTTTLFTPDELKTSPVYNEALRISGSQDSLVVRLDGPDGSRIGWELAGTDDSLGWGSAQVNTIRRLLPHIRQYVRVRHALAKVGALGASVFQLLDNRRIGAAYVDWQGRIIESNDRALELLRQREGLFDQGRFLRARLPEDNTRLQRLLAAALPTLGKAASGGSMIVRRPAGKSGLVLHVSPANTVHFRIGSWAVAALALIVEPGSLPGFDPYLVRAVFGLTPTEGRVAVMLAEGRTVRAIASALRCKENTVRYHIKQTHQKMGISRRTELVRLVMSLAGCSALRH